MQDRNLTNAGEQVAIDGVQYTRLSGIEPVGDRNLNLAQIQAALAEAALQARHARQQRIALMPWRERVVYRAREACARWLTVLLDRVQPQMPSRRPHQ